MNPLRSSDDPERSENPDPSWKRLGVAVCLGAAAMLSLGCSSSRSKAVRSKASPPVVASNVAPALAQATSDAGDVHEAPLHGVPKAIHAGDTDDGSDKGDAIQAVAKKTAPPVPKDALPKALIDKQPALLKQQATPPDKLAKAAPSKGQARRKGRVVSYVNGKRHGTWMSFYPGGQKRRVRIYQNGKRHGTWKSFFPDGQVRIEYSHKDGKRHGTFASFLKDGKSRWKGQYDMGRKDGTWKRFRKDGAMDRLYVYDKGQVRRKQIVRFTKGHKHYVITLLPQERRKELVYFYQNGKISVMRGYKKGRRHGVWARFSPTGLKRSRKEYREGKPHGAWKIYDRKGELMATRSYMLGKRHGVWTRLRKDRSTELMYTDGKLVKRVVTIMKKGKKRYIQITHPDRGATVMIGFHKNGQKKYEYNAVAGKRHGVSTEWYASGKTKKVMRFQHGLKQGPSLRWYANGKKMLQGSYEKGKRHGTWKRWNYRGTRASEGTYIHGQRHGQWVVWNVKEQPQRAPTPKASRLALRPAPKAKQTKQPTKTKKNPAKQPK